LNLSFEALVADFLADTATVLLITIVVGAVALALRETWKTWRL
jgi:hypothetical protein